MPLATQAPSVLCILFQTSFSVRKEIMDRKQAKEHKEDDQNGEW